MSDKIEPALTPEEWASGFTLRRVDWEFYASGKVGLAHPETRHAIAALCLYGQSFGFTREDVVEVMSAASLYRSHCLEHYGEIPADRAPGLTRMESLADRIEALLPPEGK